MSDTPGENTEPTTETTDPNTGQQTDSGTATTDPNTTPSEGQSTGDSWKDIPKVTEVVGQINLFGFLYVLNEANDKDRQKTIINLFNEQEQLIISFNHQGFMALDDFLIDDNIFKITISNPHEINVYIDTTGNVAGQVTISWNDITGKPIINHKQINGNLDSDIQHVAATAIGGLSDEEMQELNSTLSGN